MISESLKSSKSDEWATPDWVFSQLNAEFGFTLDPCATGKNARCVRYFTISDNGLLRSWAQETVFLNPPYSQISRWMAKAFGETRDNGATVVCLVPARTDTTWWHAYAMQGEVRFIRGRLRFGGASENAPFPTAIVIFRPSLTQGNLLTAELDFTEVARKHKVLNQGMELAKK
jgi:phage N-6-adenine-methyltransferase